MSNFVELLITEVESRPVLWNKSLKDYKNRVLVEMEWQNVALALQKNKDEVKQKWKNLRDQFQRESKKIRNPRSGDPGSPSTEIYNVKWAHFEKLKFLKIIMTPSQTETNLSVPETEKEPVVISEETPSQDSQSVEEDTHPTPITHSNSAKGFRKRKEPPLSEFDKQFLEMENKKIELIQHSQQDDEDVLFVKSLVPYLKRLPPLKRLIVRNKLQDVIITALQNEEIDEINNRTL